MRRRRSPPLSPTRLELGECSGGRQGGRSPPLPPHRATVQHQDESPWGLCLKDKQELAGCPPRISGGEWDLVGRAEGLGAWIPGFYPAPRRKVIEAGGMGSLDTWVLSWLGRGVIGGGGMQNLDTWVLSLAVAM